MVTKLLSDRWIVDRSNTHRHTSKSLRECQNHFIPYNFQTNHRKVSEKKNYLTWKFLFPIRQITGKGGRGVQTIKGGQEKRQVPRLGRGKEGILEDDHLRLFQINHSPWSFSGLPSSFLFSHIKGGTGPGTKDLPRQRKSVVEDKSVEVSKSKVTRGCLS